MALTVEDGTGLANANSYASLLFASAWNVDRASNREKWIAATATEQEAAILDARLALDSLYSWRGSIKFTTQALQWPRVQVYDPEDRLIASDSVPIAIQQAQSQLAFRIIQSGALFGASSAVDITSERIGDFAATYSDGKKVRYPEIDVIVRGLYRSGSAGGGLRVVELLRA